MTKFLRIHAIVNTGPYGYAPSKPLMDLSSIFQGSMYILTGKLSGLPSATSTISQAHIAQAETKYADWRPEPTGTLYIDRAGQSAIDPAPIRWTV